MSLQSLFNTTVTLERPVKTLDGSGGTLRDYEAVDAGIPCSLQDVTGGVVNAYSQRQLDTTHRAFFDHDTGARRGDRVTDAAGQVYMVTNFKNLAGRNRVYSLDLKARRD